MKKFFLFLLSLFVASNVVVMAQQTYPTDSLISDFKYFVRQLEATHPDPYTNYGGRAIFRRKVSLVEWNMRRDSITAVSELCRRTNAFLAPLQDGHTFLYESGGSSQSSRLAPIYFRVINDGVIVRALPKEYEKLVGARLLGVENMPAEGMREALSQFMAAENIIDGYKKVAYAANRETVLKKMFRDFSRDSLRYHLLSSAGEEVTITLPFLSWQDAERVPKASQPRSDTFPERNLTYSFVDEEKKTMYLCCRSVMARDNIEAMRDMGADYYDDVKYYYRTLGKEMPQDTAEAIAAIPSFSGTFREMLLRMKKSRSENLIIDLRGNGGGWTPITLPTLYQLWGDEYLKKSMDTKFYRILSPLYMRKINTTLEEFNERWRTNYEFGDYTFYENDRESQELTSEERDEFVENCMSCVKDELAAQKGRPVYTPRNIYVVTDSYTFSAAFHYAFYLWKMGAKIVGVASSQAPNTYMEQTAIELPVTHVKGSISNSQQIFMPVDDRRAKVFWPDMMMDYDDVKNYDFDAQAELLFLMDKVAESVK